MEGLSLDKAARGLPEGKGCPALACWGSAAFHLGFHLLPPAPAASQTVKQNWESPGCKACSLLTSGCPLLAACSGTIHSALDFSLWTALKGLLLPAPHCHSLCCSLARAFL